MPLLLHEGEGSEGVHSPRLHFEKIIQQRSQEERRRRGKGLNECGVEQLLLLPLLRLEEKEEKEEEEEGPDLQMLQEQQNPVQTEPELTSGSD